MVSLSDYQREIDGINDRVNNLFLNNSSLNNTAEPPPSPLPGYLVFVFLSVLAFLIFLLTKLEWKISG